MNNLRIMRLWRTGLTDLHIDLLDLDTGFSFEVVLSFIKFAEREKAFDIIWKDSVYIPKIRSFVEWFLLFRSIKPLKGVNNND